jgi:hypothetical protein
LWILDAANPERSPCPAIGGKAEEGSTRSA